MKNVPLKCVLLLYCLLLWGCNSVPKTADEPGWPETITFKHLAAVLDGPTLYRFQQSAYDKPSDQLLARLTGPGCISRHYDASDAPLFTNHGLGTRVYFDPRENQFWIGTECPSPHHDHNILGPFVGEPRILLDPDHHPPDRPDPFVGEYTSLAFVQPNAEYMIERNDGPDAVVIAKVQDHYLINIEPGLKFYPDQYGTSLTPAQGESGVTVRWISRIAPIDGVYIRDNTFTPGFTLSRGIGPARITTTHPETGEDRTANWSYHRHEIDATFNDPAVRGEVTYKGKPFGHGGDGPRPGTILITPIGKYMYFGRDDATNGGPRRNAGWLRVMGNGEALFNGDGTLTESGRYQRKWLKSRPIDW